jgi:hypothetical protein
LGCQRASNLEQRLSSTGSVADADTRAVTLSYARALALADPRAVAFADAGALALADTRALALADTRAVALADAQRLAVVFSRDLSESVPWRVRRCSCHRGFTEPGRGRRSGQHRQQPAR